MKKIISMLRNINVIFLYILASLSGLTAQIGAGTASSWGVYQQTLPEELSHQRK